MSSVQILIADDHELFRRSLRSLVESRPDWRVCGEAADGKEAVERTKELKPDVILLDVSMPEMNGLDAARLIRLNTPETQILIVSQNDAELMQKQALQAGAKGFIQKSKVSQELSRAVDSLMHSEENRGTNGTPTQVKARNPIDDTSHAVTLVSDNMREQHRLDAELLAAIVASSDDAIISKNLDGVITSWNKSAERIFGYTAQEAIGKSITLVIPPERYNEEVEILSRLRLGERIDHFETVRRRKDGSTLDVSLTISPVRDASGRVVGASKVARDITELKRAERTLRESEEHLRAIVETTPECVKLVAADGTLLHMNHSGLAMLGTDSLNSVVGQSVYDLIAPEDRERFRDFNENVCRGEKGTLEFDVIGFQGNRLHMETHAAPLRNSDGSMVQLAVTRDVTRRKQAEERERQITAEAISANAKFRAVFEQTTQFAGIMTEDGTVIDVNRLCLDACGYRAEEVLGRPFWETPWWRNFPESQEKIRAATSAVAGGTPYREVLYYSLADGSERLVDFALYPIVDHVGQVLFLHPTGVDITENKRTEESYRKLAESLEAEVVARTRELEERNSQLLRQSELLRDLSRRLLQAQDEERRRIARELHDSVGQTLTVLGMTLAMTEQQSQSQAGELNQSVREAEQLVQQLHQEIRTMSYLLHPPLLDEAGLAAALTWYIEGLSTRAGLELSLNMPDDFERLPREMELVVFRLVQECLTNIHRHSGSKIAMIRIGHETGRIVVEVRDHGRGISPEKLAEIQARGSGVGIRGMRERVSHFNGEIHIESDTSGTRVLVTIPFAKPVQEQPEQIDLLKAAV
jgi:PAS domain S-box-containing protein